MENSSQLPVVTNPDAGWKRPPLQVPRVKILVSTERDGLSATFGTSCPPRGLSGRIREYAYTISEGHSSHWLLLMLADRIDVLEGALESIRKRKIHNPLSEMGLQSEFKKGGALSRMGQHRADLKRQRVQLLGLALVAGTAFFGGRAINRMSRTPSRRLTGGMRVGAA